MEKASSIAILSQEQDLDNKKAKNPNPGHETTLILLSW
jgi:hypothetical protein